MASEFKVPEDTAGPEIKIVDIATGEETAGDKVFADALDATSTVEMVFTQVTDPTNTASGSLTMEIDQIDGCGFGPSDDLKYRFLCEIVGFYEYGNETYICEDSNLPTSLFCSA